MLIKIFKILLLKKNENTIYELMRYLFEFS